MIVRERSSLWSKVLLLLAIVLTLLASTVSASRGDRLPEFRECVDVCKRENCGAKGGLDIPLLHRLLLWNCPSECDYTCQHIITDQRVVAGQSIEQFHGKWPFHRVLGVQEPASVIFSGLNFWAHYSGLVSIKAAIPQSYPLRKYYVLLAYFGMASWTFSMLFHTRDFPFTEQLDYFAAGASVLYGMYYTPIRVFRWDRGGPQAQSLLRIWTAFCILLYIGHVSYLKYYAWDYTYNMAANVVCGIIQNMLWSWFSFNKYMESGRSWAVWPGVVVAWVLCAMSLELLDFPPFWGTLDAHSLWHAGTVFPAFLFYRFLLKDAQDDMAGARLKQ